MLKDMMNGTDLHGNNNTRQKFHSTVAEFKPDRRLRAKAFCYQHHYVTALLNNRFLVCVKNSEGGALLYEAGPAGEEPYEVSDIYALHTAPLREEARTQLRLHVEAKAERSQIITQRKTKMSAKKNG